MSCPSPCVADERRPATATMAGASLGRRPSSPARPRRRCPLRQPRPDADAVLVAGVRLTHPGRVLYPGQGVTKQALAEYLLAVADRMRPHLAGRALALLRCPSSRAGAWWG